VWRVAGRSTCRSCWCASTSTIFIDNSGAQSWSRRLRWAVGAGLAGVIYFLSS
jgi:hypothetical protein